MEPNREVIRAHDMPPKRAAIQATDSVRRKEVGTVRRYGLLLAGAALWLFLAAIPTLADGGPHLSSVNSGSSTLTADSCAGCHRAHTAQGEYLLIARNEEALCLSCHGAAGSGSTIDVEFGVQYVPAVPGPAGRASTTSYAISAVTGGLITATGSNLVAGQSVDITGLDRKSTRLNSSHRL